MKRGHETASHLAMKRHVADVLRRRGWMARGEACNADVTAYKPGREGIWTLECERSPKWVVRNVLKDIGNGARWVVVVAETSTVVEAVRRQLERLPSEIRARVQIVTINEFSETYVENRMERERYHENQA